MKNNQEKQIELYKHIINLNPYDVRMINTLAKVYLEEGKEDLAFKYFDKAIEIAPTDAEAYNAYGLIYFEKKEYKKAYLYLRKATDFDFNYYKNHYDIAKAYIGLNDFENAKKSLEICLNLNPEFDLAKILLSKLN